MDASPAREISSAPPGTRPVAGTVLLDGSINGCGGDELAIRVRDDTGVIASVFAKSEVVGFDCIYAFAMDVPVQKCYEVNVEQQPVGRYSEGALGPDGDLGIITSLSAFGDPESLDPPRAYGDFKNC
ncbi:hypothetical protein GCM10023340_19460 [Nocardioides marinquilinus]|uniref:LppP/LprE family lipoprotein n=1 Tax=Nocardioides marinquilinus TaxID=1210400 RepID=A0ABP9PLX5_9ACTN